MCTVKYVEFFQVRYIIKYSMLDANRWGSCEVYHYNYIIWDVLCTIQRCIVSAVSHKVNLTVGPPTGFDWTLRFPENGDWANKWYSYGIREAKQWSGETESHFR